MTRVRVFDLARVLFLTLFPFLIYFARSTPSGMFVRGEGVAQDVAAAVKLYRLAIDSENEWSMCNLARLHQVADLMSRGNGLFCCLINFVI